MTTAIKEKKPAPADVVFGQYQTGTWRITGMSPLLMDNGDQVLNAATGAKTKQVASEKDAIPRLYRNLDGTLYLPTAAFRKCLVSIKHMTLGKTTAASVLRSSVFTVAPKTPLLYPKSSKPIKEFEVIPHVVTNRKTAGGLSRLVAFRPVINEWAADLMLSIDVGQLADPASDITKFLNRQGVKCGVGCFRVENGGEYGRFKAEFVGMA